MTMRGWPDRHLGSAMLRSPACLALLTAIFLAGAQTAHADTWTDLWSTHEQQAQKLLDSKHPDAAAPLFKDARRRAYAELEAGQYAKAAKSLAPFKDADSQYNRGNALAHSGQLREALTAYDAALAAAPGDKDVIHNRDVVKRALEQQKNQAGQQGGSNGRSGSQGSKGGQSQGGNHSPGGGQPQAGNQGNGQSQGGNPSQPDSQSQAADQPQSGSQSQANNQSQSGNQSGGGNQPQQGSQSQAANQNGSQSRQNNPAQGNNPSQNGGQAQQSPSQARNQPQTGTQSGGSSQAGPQSQGANPSQAANPLQGRPQSEPGAARPGDNSGEGGLAPNGQPTNDSATTAALNAENAKKDADAALRYHQSQQGRAAPGTSTADAGQANVLGGNGKARSSSDLPPPPKPPSEQALALDQWLRGIPDDSAELLRRKFLIEHMLKQQQQRNEP